MNDSEHRNCTWWKCEEELAESRKDKLENEQKMKALDKVVQKHKASLDAETLKFSIADC